MWDGRVRSRNEQCRDDVRNGYLRHEGEGSNDDEKQGHWASHASPNCRRSKASYLYGELRNVRKDYEGKDSDDEMCGQWEQGYGRRCVHGPKWDPKQHVYGRSCNDEGGAKHVSRD